MKVLIIDNYDSFTFNLVHILKQFPNVDLDVFRNDRLNPDDVEKYDKILLSPGPGIPSEAGRMMEIIKRYASSKCILGVCLGHQGIAECFGAKLKNLDKVMHGVATKTLIIQSEEPLFKGMADGFLSGRYHSWVVDPENLPDCLTVTARDEDNYIMGISHKTLDVKGIQFHPESILTENGMKIIQNWLEDYV